jgi:hypothetical protein
MLLARSGDISLPVSTDPSEVRGHLAAGFNRPERGPGRSKGGFGTGGLVGRERAGRGATWGYLAFLGAFLSALASVLPGLAFGSFLAFLPSD